ncbi:MAG: ketoacyl-ACP synthase III [Alphaproteobacteria bacterium]|nr:MAG: ketoacyl-ACP synthase III [Alphaproteobacteria bacterium]
MSFDIRVISTGSALPKQVWTNEALIEAKGLESNDQWIRERTGITQRYIVSEGETTFTLARDAVKEALTRAGVPSDKVGVLIVATCTPDLTFPSVAALVHGDLGFAHNSVVLDINAACSGFVHGLAVARSLMLASDAEFGVVVGAETFSNLLDWNDRTTCVLFGDGAGAVVLKKEAAAGQGVLAIDMGADGTCAPHLQSSAGVARGRAAGNVLMNGREVYKHAVRQMGSKAEAEKLLAHAGLHISDVNWVVPHQANLRIIEASAAGVGVPMDKVVVTVDQHANTSAATIPLALDVAVKDGRIKTGDVVMLQAFGAGFAWSGAVVRW